MAKDCLAKPHVAFKNPNIKICFDDLKNKTVTDEHGRVCMDILRGLWGLCGGCTLIDPIDQSKFFNNILYDYISIYFEPSNNIKRMRDMYIKKYKIIPNRACYVYIRRTDKLHGEASEVNYNKIFNNIKNILNKNKTVNMIILQTDDIQLIPVFKNRLNSNIKLKIINETFLEMPDDILEINNIDIDADIKSRPAHKTGDVNTRISLVESFMVSLQIGVRCKCSIMTPSTAVTLFNMWKVMKGKMGPDTDMLLTT